jgi:thiamine pyrophosphate-dependent acetolactate synthase large subunit-like protein
MDNQMNPERPQNIENISMTWGSDAIAELLRCLDLNYIAFNPGASFKGLHDSIVNYLGNKNPQMLLALHEESAVAIAHGYAKITGKPMGVVVHSNVGLMHASMAIYNAWCDRVPVFILGATGPVDAAQRRPWIDWIHTAQDQSSLVRNYTKWDDQPASVPAAFESLLRAYQMSLTEPCGPVYVCLDAAIQDCELEKQISVPDPSRFQPAAPQEASQRVLLQAAELLMEAKKPLILPGRVSRSQEHWNLRVRVAELLGALVVTDMKVGAAFPTGHALHGAGPDIFLSKKAIELIRNADVILSLDWVDLAGTLKQVWGTRHVEAKVIHCSVDGYVHRGWSMDYQGLPPVDLPILAEPDVILPQLLAFLEASGRSGSTTDKTVEHKSPVGSQGAVEAITHYEIANALKMAVGKRKTCLIRLPLGWPADACDFQDPLDYLGTDGGGGVGAGPGMAVGAALALRESVRLPVAILGDGDYLMGISALWTAARYKIPLLIIVANNRVYGNCVRHQEGVAKLRGRPTENKWIGQRIDNPPVDLGAMARAQGLDAEGPIENFEDLTQAFERAVEAVENGRCYVVDVKLSL